MTSNLRDYFKYNTLTTSEVSELLQIPKSKILSMVEEKVIQPLKVSAEGLLFLKQDIDGIIKDRSLKLPIHRIHYRNIMNDGTGYTNKSIEFFEENITKLGRIESIFIYFNSIDAVKAGFFKIYKNDEEYDSKHLYSVDTPSFVIRDVQGNEIWLGGCKCGYGGKGSGGSKTILKKLGLNQDVIDLIPYYRVINIFINDDGNIEIIYNNGIDRTSQNSRVVDDLDVSVLFSKEINNLVLVQEDSRISKNKAIDILKGFRSFIPFPKKILLLPSFDMADRLGYVVEIDSRDYFSFYNLIVVDSSGKQLWVNIPYKVDVPINSQDEICNILEYLGFDVPEEKMANKIVHLFNAAVSKKIDPEPIVFEKQKKV